MASVEQRPQPATPRLDTTTIAVPEKAALSSTAAIPMTPTEKTPRTSNASTPRTEQSGNPFDTDIEAMITTNDSEGHPRRSEAMQRTTDCQVWPDKKEWRKKAKAAKMKRGCGCMAKLSKRNRLLVKLLIVVLIVGIAFGVGFGVSKPLGAPIWGHPHR